ncbi:precorrin-2 dehydrogenase/sirohydrochlorin ferrochelatase family protein [Floccifex sp.]|uniref:precorrin-2 dehydrogenase/sirohydrochlorin ferrochelatase family protein n=1 Tax=Floccifex sp. TaxID=2815810 RepID=UPI003F0D1987
MAYFPFFIELKNQNVLVIGSGPIAKSKIKTLQEFGAIVTCISNSECDMNCIHIQKAFEISDLDGFSIVVISTNDKNLNHKIAKICKEKHILVNAVDQKEDCTFIFPSIIKKKDIVAAFSSSGKNPVICQYLKKQNEKIVSDQLACINEKMENIRKELMHLDAKERKQILNEFLEKSLQEQ